MNFVELSKIENEQNWKFVQLIIGFSIGILAFSIQTSVKDLTLTSKVCLFISWLSLFISFGSGLGLLLYMRKIMKCKSSRAQIEESKKNTEQLKSWNIKLNKYNSCSKTLSWAQGISFLVGLVTFALYKLFILVGL